MGDVTEILGELLKICTAVTSPYGGVKNARIGARNLNNINEWVGSISYADAALPGATKVLQWWDIRRGSPEYRPLEIGGTDALTEEFILEGNFGWTDKAIGGTVTFPPLAAVSVNSEIVWNEIIDTLLLELGKPANYHLPTVTPNVIVRGVTLTINELANVGENMLHHVVIRLTGLERQV